MTDIVERLRDHERSELDICMEAADELERLRAELSTLRAATASVQSDQRGAIDQARELLRVMTSERDALRACVAHESDCAEAFKAEADSLRADALRYRWLRDCDRVSLYRGNLWLEGVSNLDAAIDAAMAAQTTDS